MNTLKAHPRLALAVILTCQLMVVLDSTIVTIALPNIQHAFKLSSANLSWVQNAYTLSFGGLLLLGARAGDILGRRRVFLYGVALFTVSSLLGGLAQNSAELLSARAVQGIGGALASPTALAILMTMFPDGKERIRAVASYTVVSIAGAATGLLAGGILTQYVDWRWVFFVNVPIGIAVVVLGIATLVDNVGIKGKLDVGGALSSTIGMTALAYGFVHAATSSWGSPETLISFALGVALLIAFVRIETTAEAPITPLRLFADRNRSTAFLARLLMTAGMLGMFFFLSQFMQEVLGYDPLHTGLGFLPMPVTVFATTQLTMRKLMPKFETKTLVLAGIGAASLGMIWLTTLSASSSYADVVGPIFVFAFGNGLAFLPLTNLALLGVEPRDAGAASGVVNAMQQVGGSLGLAILVTVFGAESRSVLSHPHGLTGNALAQHALVRGSVDGFRVAVLLLLASLALVAIAVRTDKRARLDAELVELEE